MVGLFCSSTAQASAPMMSELKLSPKVFARQIVGDHKQYKCLATLWTFESHWNPLAKNKQPVYQIRNGKRVALHAFGIAQLLGETSRIPYIQIQKGLRYIEHRYLNPCRALDWHLRHHWY